MSTPNVYYLQDDSAGVPFSLSPGSGAQVSPDFVAATLAQAQQVAQLFANLFQRTVRLVAKFSGTAAVPPYTAYPASLTALGFASASGFATSTTATTLVNTGATFPVATAGTSSAAPTQGLLGCIVAVGPNNAGAGAVAFGIVTANTATSITVAQWTSPTSNTGGAAATPNGTCSYEIFNPIAPVAAGLSGVSF